MSAEVLPGMFGIGRTCNTQRRLIDHNKGLPFKFRYEQLFLAAGPTEQAIHLRLARYRHTGGLGREWFTGLSIEHVFVAIEEEINGARKPGGSLSKFAAGGNPGDAGPNSFVDLTGDSWSGADSTVSE